MVSKMKEEAVRLGGMALDRADDLECAMWMAGYSNLYRLGSRVWKTRFERLNRACLCPLRGGPGYVAATELLWGIGREERSVVFGRLRSH